MTFQQWLDCFNPSIICLQGTHSTSEHEIKQWFKDTSFSIASSPGSIHSAGVLILFKNTIKCEQSWRDKFGISYHQNCQYLWSEQPKRRDPIFRITISSFRNRSIAKHCKTRKKRLNHLLQHQQRRASKVSILKLHSNKKPQSSDQKPYYRMN